MVVVQDAEAFQQLPDRVEWAEAIEGIRRGLEAAARGEGRPAEEVFAEIRSKYDIPHEE